MTEAFVYSITNNLSRKVYVGKTTDLKSRWKHHRCTHKWGWVSLISRAIRKYGVENFTFTVLASYQSEEEAYLGEVDWISRLQSNNPDMGYNLESGGMGGKIASEETRRKQSKLHKGVPRPPGVIAKLHSPEARKKVADAKRGQHLSEATKEKISAAHIGRSKSPESVAKSAASHRGRVLSEDHRKKLSLARKGKPHTPEHRAKLAEANKLRAATQRGVPLTLEHRAKVSFALKGKPKPPGRVLSEEHKIKLSLATKGRPLSTEHRAKLAEANRVNGVKRRGVPLTPERRANMSAAQKGRSKSPEHIAKVVAAKMAARIERQAQSQSV